MLSHPPSRETIRWQLYAIAAVEEHSWRVKVLRRAVLTFGKATLMLMKPHPLDQWKDLLKGQCMQHEASTLLELRRTSEIVGIPGLGTLKGPFHTTNPEFGFVRVVDMKQFVRWVRRERPHLAQMLEAADADMMLRQGAEHIIIDDEGPHG